MTTNELFRSFPVKTQSRIKEMYDISKFLRTSQPDSRMSEDTAALVATGLILASELEGIRDDLPGG